MKKEKRNEKEEIRSCTVTGGGRWHFALFGSDISIIKTTAKVKEKPKIRVT